MKTFLSIFILSLHWGNTSGFSTAKQCRHLGAVSSSSALGATPVDSIPTTTEAVNKLKKVLQREYVSFFDPMQQEFYAESVSFEDPMTSLSGVDSYQNNVDMLSSRTLFGKFFFKDAGIVLHSITGGEVNEENGAISNIITRWSLRVTVQALPWKPTARFTGISEYEVVPGGSEGVLVQHQTDYWDSINIQEGGRYAKVDKGIAIKDFLDQLKPENGNAAAAGPEVPYSLLRRGNGYEVRKYPSYSYAKIPYTRRDEGYDLLASVTQGMDPLAPAIMEVFNDDSEKTMAWPLAYAAPGENSPPPLNSKVQERMKDPMWSDCEITTMPGTVVAVGSFSDASVAPIVRKADKNLRAALENDGISIPKESETSVKFAQYDAIFTLGKRRGEVWIELEDGGHPW
mmetsp:Transcript_8377/g.20155  ORF Transcript_8377/g.20155 Transcript_8377/m.20155 type:complete len:400 (+) Transcript_8377:1560-2759(+)